MSGKKSPPQMSVIVPAYNAGETLVHCIKAVRGQKGVRKEDIEIIVVDDDSDDKSANAVAGLADRVIRLEENQGAAAARNRGAREASGELLVFVDADVLPAPQALPIFCRAFHEDPSLRAAVGGYTELPALPGLVNKYHNAFTRYHHDLSPKDIDWFWGALGAVKKEAFHEVGGFDERYRAASAEDMELGKALYSAGCRIAYLPAVKGAHAHDFSLSGMLKNDYKKAVLGTKLRLKGRLPARAPGFAGKRNIATSALAVLLAALVFLWLFHPLAGVSAVFVVCLLAMINLPYYGSLARVLKPSELIICLPLHWLQFVVILSGGVMGLVGHLLGRDTFGRPGWI